MWILANLAAGSSLPDHVKGNGPRKHPGPLHHALTRRRLTRLFYSWYWASGLVDGGRRGNRANATRRRTRPRGLSSGCRVFHLPQRRVNARTRLNEYLRPCRVDHTKSGSSKNGQIRCVGMNFDTPTSPLRVSEDVIATIMFGSLGHWTTDPFPLRATPQPMISSGEGRE